MKTSALLLTALTLAACQNDTKNLNDKIDKLDKKLDALIAQGGRGGNNAGAQPQRPSRPEPDKSKTYAISIDGDPFDGPADAKVTVVKAYDYACPYCERTRTTMEELHKKYGDDIRVVYKQLVVHPQTAMTGALAFCAAAKQGKAAQMDALLWDKGFKARQFDTDQCWTSGNCEKVNAMAQELKLDMGKFKEDMKGCQSLVQNDMRELQKFGVGATPAFFINGRYLVGAMPVDNFSTVIDEELKKANERIQQGTPQAQYYQQWVMDKGLKTLEAPKQ
jgi:protein-disulfide isomerase